MRRRYTLLTTLLVISISPIVLAAALPDTGQTLCDNGTNTMVACSNTNMGDASTMPRQDGRFGRDPATTAGVVTKVGGGAAGFDYTTVSALECVQDNITGLMWEVKTTDGGLRDKRWKYTWYSANAATNIGVAGLKDTGTDVGSDNCLDAARCDTEKYVADVNAANLCNFADWRMPSKRELQTITHYGTSLPAIDTTYFPNTTTESAFWTTSAVVKYPNDARVVDFSSGYDGAGFKTFKNHVRLVRGGQF